MSKKLKLSTITGHAKWPDTCQGTGLGAFTISLKLAHLQLIFNLVVFSYKKWEDIWSILP